MKKHTLQYLREKGSMLVFTAVIAATALIYGCHKSPVALDSKASADAHVTFRD